MAVAVRSEFFVKELSLKNFMCYKEAHLILRHRCTLLCGPNSSGKSALLKAVEFITTKRYKHEAEAKCLVRNGAEEDGFVKILFDCEDKASKVVNITVIRYFSDLEYVHLEHEGRSVRIGFDTFHQEFKLNSEISGNFFSLDIEWNNLENINMLHFFKFNVSSEADEENIVEMAKEMQRKESFSFVEKLLIEEEVLEMLWYLKHYDRKRILKGQIQQNKFICPPCDEVNHKAEHEYNLLLAEISNFSLSAQILAAEEQMHLETKEIETLYDEYKKLIAVIGSYATLMGKADDFYLEYMDCFKDAKKIIRKLICDTVQLIENDNEEFRTEFSKILNDMTSDEAKSAVQQFISETEPKMYAAKKQYLRQRRILARLHRKFYRKQAKKDTFLEFLQSYKKKFTEHLAYKHINLADEAFDLKMELIEINQLWIQRVGLSQMRRKLEDCFSFETTNAINFLWNINLTHDIKFVFVTLKTFDDKQISLSIEYDPKFDDVLPVVKFTNENDYEEAKLFIQKEDCNIKYKFISSYNIELESICDDQFLVLDHKTVLSLLEEWLVVLGENLTKFPSFMYSEDLNNVISGGYVNVKRYELYKRVLATGEDIDQQTAKLAKSKEFENKYNWITSMWDHAYKDYNVKQLGMRFDENNQLCSNLCNLGKDILEAQRKSLRMFKTYHWYSAKFKLLKTIFKQSEARVKTTGVSLDEYSIVTEELTLKQDELNQYGMNFINCLHENHFLSYMWSLNKVVVELQLSVFCEIVRLFDDRLNALIHSQSENTTKILEANEARYQMEVFQKNHKHELDEQEEFLRRKHFPLNYGTQNLNWSNYEKSVYEKYKNLDFFEIHFKLRDSREFITFYKEKFGYENIPDRKEMRLIIKNTEQLISLKKMLDKVNRDCGFRIFVDFTKQIDEIFRIISKQNVSVHFYVENDEDMWDIQALDIDFKSFPNLVTMIKDGTTQYLWTSMPRLFRFILVLSVHLAVSLQFDRNILCVENCNVGSIFMQDFRQFPEVGEKSGLNYLQNIVDFCNEQKLSMFMECRETVQVSKCNLVICQNDELGSKCRLINVSDNVI